MTKVIKDVVVKISPLYVCNLFFKQITPEVDGLAGLVVAELLAASLCPTSRFQLMTQLPN